MRIRCVYCGGSGKSTLLRFVLMGLLVGFLGAVSQSVLEVLR